MRAAALGLALLLAGAGVAEAASARNTYILRCAGCHGMDGAATARGDIPQLRDFVGAFAGSEDGRTYLVHVPGVAGSGLSDDAVAGVLNYVLETFGGVSVVEPFEEFSAEEVAARRAIAVEDAVAYRRGVVEALAAEGIETAEYPWP